MFLQKVHLQLEKDKFGKGQVSNSHKLVIAKFDTMFNLDTVDIRDFACLMCVMLSVWFAKIFLSDITDLVITIICNTKLVSLYNIC